MENIKRLQWRPVYLAYGLAVISFILLFFTGSYETGLNTWLSHNDANDIVVGITLRKILLFVLDICMLIVIMVPLKNEDERVDKIRNFALKQSFIAGLAASIGLGLLMNQNFNLLYYAGLAEVYYFFLFALCLQRDSVIVYMNYDELNAYNKLILKRFKIYFFIQNIIFGIALAIVRDHFHRPDLLWAVVAVNIVLLVFIKTIYISWKN